MKTWWQLIILSQVPLSVNKLKHDDSFILLTTPKYNVVLSILTKIAWLELGKYFEYSEEEETEDLFV